jgi:hypothetical protein
MVTLELTSVAKLYGQTVRVDAEWAEHAAADHAPVGSAFSRTRRLFWAHFSSEEAAVAILARCVLLTGVYRVVAGAASSAALLDAVASSICETSPTGSRRAYTLDVRSVGERITPVERDAILKPFYDLKPGLSSLVDSKKVSASYVLLDNAGVLVPKKQQFRNGGKKRKQEECLTSTTPTSTSTATIASTATDSTTTNHPAVHQAADTHPMYLAELLGVGGGAGASGGGGAKGGRHGSGAAARLGLHKRAFVGATAMDPALAMVMANVALVHASSLVLDPFVGSAGVLLGCACATTTTTTTTTTSSRPNGRGGSQSNGCITVGADADLKAMSGDGPARDISANFDAVGDAIVLPWLFVITAKATQAAQASPEHASPVVSAVASCCYAALTPLSPPLPTHILSPPPLTSSTAWPPPFQTWFSPMCTGTFY